MSLRVGSEGVSVQSGGGFVWRFHNKEDTWRVSLAPEFVALETTSYSSRTEFFASLENILHALNELVRLEVYDRLGVRYINRVVGEDVDRLAEFVWPEVLGIAATSFSESLVHTLCESRFKLADSLLTTRWGILPPDLTPDPSAIEPVGERSWILDLDMFTGGPKAFSSIAVATEGRHFAERVYAFFRWTVRDELLVRFGGRP